MLISVVLGLPRLPPMTYATHEPVEPGMRVLVPLAKRIVTGIVVPTAPENLPGVRNIIEVLDEVPTIPPSVIELTRRMSEYYLCSWGEALFAALPSGLAPGTVIRVQPTRSFSPDELSEMEMRAPRRTDLLRFLLAHNHDLTVQYIQKQLKSQSVSEQLDALHRAGYVLITTELEQSKPRTVRGIVLAEHLTSSEDAIAAVFDELDKNAPKQSLVLGQLYIAHRQGLGPLNTQALCSEVGTTTAVIDALIAKGYADSIQIPKPKIGSRNHASLAQQDERSLQLSDEQRKAVEAISLSGFATYLLDGITGSGKTLVYIRVMESVLKQGKSCLMLVPEIALTPQLHDRFAAVFGDSVTVLHSRMSMTERVSTWQNIASGKITVVIGARSTVLSPIHNVGIIVVDEEHEPSYKQDDPAPRYHGRDVAVMRAAIEECPIILGSATPSLESLYNVQGGRYKRLTLTKRSDGAQLPRITVVSLSEAQKQRTLHGTLSDTLVQAVRARIEKNEGTILFLNRRGFANQLTCTDCSHVATCPQCDVHLTWHKQPGVLRCHYCGHTEPVRTACVVCGGLDLRDIGIGTQRVEEDLTAALKTVPPANGTEPVIVRMDSDTMRKTNAHRTTLERFANGHIDVIIGTQMIAKGLDLDRVTLVGVVLADQGLHQSDFRAAERTVQLLFQVAGRSGRKAEHPGEVIIQTYAPSHSVIQTLCNNSLQEWQRDELLQRKETMFPPFSRFITIEVTGIQEERVEHAARILEKLIPANEDSIVPYPPLVPAVAWIRNRHRRIIVVKNPKHTDPSGARGRAVLSKVLSIYDSQYADAAVRVTVDMDSSGAL